MKKITILALHLGYGGIERAITDLANNLVDTYDVTIVSTYKIYDHPVNKLDKRVRVKYLTNLKPNKKELKESIKKLKLLTLVKECYNAAKILILRKKLMINYIKKCNSDVIISTRDIHNFWLGKYGSKNSLKIGWEHNHHHGNMVYAKRIIKSTNSLDYLVLVSKDLTKFYKNKTNAKCIYIPNMIEKSKVISKLKDKNIISIGRLEQVKGYSGLIDVFELVNQEYSDWTLNIIGDGTEKTLLQNKIKVKKLEDKIILHGYLDKKEMEPILKKSSIYVMSSLSESFGIVLLEAFSHGIPCIAFDSAEGAKEIITNNKDGYLIEERNKEKMKEKICELINSYEKRLELGKRGLEKSLEFDSDKVKEKWIELIK